MAKTLESWRLFWVLALATTVAIGLGLPLTDFHSKQGAEFMVLHAVLCALPCLLVAFTASSLATLWPSPRTRWLLSNRRYFGLAFAFGMAWHFMFVSYFMISFGKRLPPRDLTLDLIGIVFLVAMTLTSFRRIARRLSLRNWRRLHKTGIYTLWFLPTFFYFDDFVRDQDFFDAAVISVLVAAVLLRGIAWGRRPARLRTAS